LKSQVAGHAGISTIENESLLIKPAVPTEVAFYERLKQDSNLEGLRVFTPTFLGTLELMGKIDETSSTVSEAIVSAEEKEFIVLENLSFPFLKPNILDVKLGTVLHDKNAPPEKAARKQKYARDTTSFETGIRLTAFQVYDNITCQPVQSCGRSLKAAQLGEGIAKFFPLCSPTSQTSDTPSSSSGLPKETLEPILRAIYEEVAEMREVYSSLEIRAVGASLLIIYEADWTRAEQSLRSFSEDNEEDGDDIDDDDIDDDDNDDDDDEDESNSKRPGPPFVAKLIDFAHTYLAPNEGP